MTEDYAVREELVREERFAFEIERSVNIGGKVTKATIVYLSLGFC